MKRAFLLLYLLYSCTPASPWQLDAISAGEKTFNSARLKYTGSNNSSPLRFEMTRVGDDIESYLHLVRYSFASSNDNASFVKVFFTLGEEQKEEWIPLLEGAMKLHIPPEMTRQITRALQKGEKVSIVSDDFEEVLSPESFSELYEKLTGSTIFFQNPIKGPLQ